MVLSLSDRLSSLLLGHDCSQTQHVKKLKQKLKIVVLCLLNSRGKNPKSDVGPWSQRKGSWEEVHSEKENDQKGLGKSF